MYKIHSLHYSTRYHKIPHYKKKAILKRITKKITNMHQQVNKKLNDAFSWWRKIPGVKQSLKLSFANRSNA